jgi:hypothetical protein
MEKILKPRKRENRNLENNNKLNQVYAYFRCTVHSARTLAKSLKVGPYVKVRDYVYKTIAHARTLVI